MDGHGPGTLSLAAILTANPFSGKQCSRSVSKLLDYMHFHMPMYLPIGTISIPSKVKILNNFCPSSPPGNNVAVEFLLENVHPP
jgi:hypothetical protein